MSEVSGKTLALFRKISLRTQVSVETIFAGSTSPPAEGNDPEYITWTDFCLLCRNACKACGGNRQLAEMGAEVIELPEVGRIVGIIRFVASAYTIYWANTKFSGPAMFNHLQNELDQLPGGLFRFTITIPPEHEDCPEFFYLNSGVLRTVPKVIGLSEAFVEFEISERKCIYTIDPPPSMTVWARIRRAFSILFSARTALEELSDQQSLLAKRYKELQATREDLERARDDAIASRQAAEQALTIKSQFLATMSHELRTPLNGVLGMSQLLLTTELNTEQADYAQTVVDCGQNLLDLISDILDFSKIEMSELTLHLSEVNLYEVVEHVLEMVSSQARAQGTEVGARFGDIPRLVVTDALRLQQVLVNLVGNAVKFTQGGEVFVTVEEVEHLKTSTRLRFEVRDTGIGIPDDFVSKLFMPFTQVDSSNSRKYGGTGLGLAISKEIVDHLGGTLRVESEVGKGSLFYFSILAQLPTNAAANEKKRVLAPIGSYRALVVDDNATNRVIIRRALESWGLEVSAVASAKEALSLLNEQPHDLAVLDLRMPEMDGFGLANQIQASPGICEPKLLMLTSSGNRTDAETAAKLGISRYLTKPFRHAQLHRAVRELLESDAATSTVPARTTRTASPTPPRTPCTLLVVDDNPINRHFAVRAFERLGHQVTGVAGGREALDEVAECRFDIIFMDFEMPEMNGLEATRKLRKMANAATTPIIALTAHANDDIRQQCIDAGMNGYIAKPPSLDTLREVLDKWRDRSISATPANV